MARQATKLRAQRPPPGALICLAGAVGAAAAVTPDLSADSRGRSFEALCDPPYRPTGGNASRNLFALLKPQRYQSPPAWRWSNASIASQDPIDAALVPPLKRSRDLRHTLTALPALPQLSLLFRREPCPCMPLHSHTSSSAKIRRCCVDSLNSPGQGGRDVLILSFSAFDPERTEVGLKSRSAAASCHIVCRHGRGRHSAPPRFRTIQFGPTKCVNNSTDLRCKSGIVCAGLVMPTVNLTRILSEAGGISSVGIRMSSVGIWISIVSTSVSSTIDPANVPTVGSIILCISM